MNKFIVAWCEYNNDERDPITVGSFGELYDSREDARKAIRECIIEDLTNDLEFSDIKYDIDVELNNRTLIDNNYDVVVERPIDIISYYNISEVRA